MVACENTPCNNNGKKKGYIEVMKQLWDEMGYGHFGLKGQNLRDQASRLEKNQENVMDSANDSRTTVMGEVSLDASRSVSVIVENITSNEGLDEILNQNSNDQQSRNANQSIPDLHTSPEQLPEEPTPNSASENALRDMPGSLPEYEAVNTPSTFIWGQNSEGSLITVTTSTIEDAYNEITKWRKNTFLVPYGKTGKDCIDMVTKHINDSNNGSDMQHISLKAALILLAVCLQKPSQNSKAKEHQECLARRLKL